MQNMQNTQLLKPGVQLFNSKFFEIPEFNHLEKNACKNKRNKPQQIKVIS